MKKCSGCGTTTNDNVRFCSKCGSSQFIFDSNASQHQGTNYQQQYSSNQQGSNYQQNPSNNQQSTNYQQQYSKNQQNAKYQQQYSDNQQQDATIQQNQETLVSNTPPTDFSAGYVEAPIKTKKKSRAVVWVVIIILLLLLSGGAVAGYLIYDATQSTETPTETKADNSDKQDNPDTPEAQEDSGEEPAGPAEEIEHKEAEQKETIHKVYKKDITWTNANSMVSAINAKLVSVNSEEEFAEICNMADSKGLCAFWMGASRPANSSNWNNVKWADGTSFTYTKWLENEPSINDKDGNPERYLLALKVGESWYFNDAPNDISEFYPGQIGYIVEIEE